MVIKAGDLVACYLTNTSEYETLFQWGIVLDTNEHLEDVLVLDNNGSQRWWPSKRWRLLKKRPSTEKEKNNGV